jgi:hypothetical protein
MGKEKRGRSSDELPLWSFIWWKQPGAERIYSRAWWDLRQNAGGPLPPSVDPLVDDYRPSWCQIARPPPRGPGQPLNIADTSGGTALIEDARGWPFLAMYCSIEPIGVVGGPEFPTRDGIKLSRVVSQMGGMEAPRALPVRPIWMGFLLNTALYALLTWLLVWLVLRLCLFAIRGRVRLRKGLCPACAYPIGGSVICTECGRKLPMRQRVA